MILRLKAAYATDAGIKKKSYIVTEEDKEEYNCDSISILDKNPSEIMLKDPRHIVCTIADGTHISLRSKAYSRFAAEESASRIDKIRGSLRNLEKKIKEILECINEEIYGDNCKSGAVKSNYTGTTLDLCFIQEQTLYVAHVGDSKVYLLRKGKLTQITEDHTPGWESHAEWTLHNPGKIEGREILKVRDNGPPIVLGRKEKLEKHSIYEIRVLPDDRIFMATDGLADNLTDKELKEILGRGKNLNEICNELINRANNPEDVINLYLKHHPGIGYEEAKNKLAGHDNISAVVIEVYGIGE